MGKSFQVKLLKESIPSMPLLNDYSQRLRPFKPSNVQRFFLGFLFNFEAPFQMVPSAATWNPFINTIPKKRSYITPFNDLLQRPSSTTFFNDLLQQPSSTTLFNDLLQRPSSTTFFNGFRREHHLHWKDDDTYRPELPDCWEWAPCMPPPPVTWTANRRHP